MSKTIEPKKFKLTPEEVSNIKFRRTVMDYLNEAVHNDLGQYLYNNVCPRLKLEGEKVEITADGEWLVIIPPDIDKGN
jgi:hypothetical protein